MVYERDKHICQVCGKSDQKDLEAHHIFPWRIFPSFRNELWNGITLCHLCHAQTWGKEMKMAPYFAALLKNDANSVKTHSDEVGMDNTEPTRGGDSAEGVTTRSRVLEQLKAFFRREVPCTKCNKPVLVHHFRIEGIKHHFCSKECRYGWLAERQTGSQNQNYREPMKHHCLNCNQPTVTPSSPHRAKKYCNNTCQLKYEYAHGLKKRLMPYLNGRWTKQYAACLVCNETSSAHSSKGVCNRCYSRAKTLRERQ